jgi:hypothetical protein
MTTDSDDQTWFWDLTKNHAVPAAERGKGDNTLGPYSSKSEAENWRSKVESRNDEWDDSSDDRTAPIGE